MDTTYFVGFKMSFENINDATSYLTDMAWAYNIDPRELEVGYYMEQPKYKKWVPKWLINLIKQN